MSPEEVGTIWVFHAEESKFTSGVFTTKLKAEQWIALHKLSGILTKYPVDTGVYDWAIEADVFRPTKEYQTSANFVGKFTSASQEHYHY
ncbi:MAG: hypothetical protein P1V19_08400 [Gimesia sp.]|nr:hypothetical protein [Gimesia sp.]